VPESNLPFDRKTTDFDHSRRLYHRYKAAPQTVLDVYEFAPITLQASESAGRQVRGHCIPVVTSSAVQMAARLLTLGSGFCCGHIKWLCHEHSDNSQ
jgi:hypothetical protein